MKSIKVEIDDSFTKALIDSLIEVIGEADYPYDAIALRPLVASYAKPTLIKRYEDTNET